MKKYFIIIFSLLTLPFLMGMKLLNKKLAKVPVYSLTVPMQSYAVKGRSSSPAALPMSIKKQILSQQSKPSLGDNFLWKRIKQSLNIKDLTTPAKRSVFVKIKTDKGDRKDSSTITIKKSATDSTSIEIIEPIPENLRAMPITESLLELWKKTSDSAKVSLQYAATVASRDIPSHFNKTPNLAKTSQTQELQQAKKSYWQWIAGGLASLLFLFDDKKNASSDYIDLSLDGELASTLSAEEFVKLLHKYGLTVADSVKAHVSKKEEELWTEIQKVANLSSEEGDLLRRIINLKNEWKQKNQGTGHYEEKNITFEGKFHPFIIQTIKDTFQKADMPFKVTVRSTRGNFIASVSCPEYELEINLMDAVLKNLNLELELSLNRAYFTRDQLPSVSDTEDEEEEERSSYLTSQHLLAHETIHLTQLHTVETILFKAYFRKYGSRTRDCENILYSLQEYQADILPLAYLPYAVAAEHLFENTGRRASIYITAQEGFKLASRAIALHRAEEQLLKEQSVNK